MRNYANVTTAIWAPDSDFRKLPARGQWGYLMLLSQPDISAAGTLALRLRRWSKMSAGTTVDELREIFAELEAAHYIVVDHDSEELLVRSFVRWDNGYTNPKRRPVILRSALEVESTAIRSALSEEFTRLGLPIDGLPNGDPDSLSDSYFGAIPDDAGTHITQPSRPCGDPPKSAQRNSLSVGLSNGQSDGISPSNGVVVTQGGTNPQPTTHNPQPFPASPSEDAAPPGIFDTELIDHGAATVNLPAVPESDNAGKIVSDWIDHCAAHGVKLTKRLIGQYAKGIKGALDEGFSVELIKHALASMLDDHVADRPSYLSSRLVAVQTGPERRRSIIRSTADDRVAGWAALAESLGGAALCTPGMPHMY